MTTTATRKLATGEYQISDHGRLRIRLDRHHDGITITVLCGADRNDLLSRAFPNHELSDARVWYRDLTAAADAAVPVRRIEADMQVLAEAALAVAHVERSRA